MSEEFQMLDVVAEPQLGVFEQLINSRAARWAATALVAVGGAAGTESGTAHAAAADTVGSQGCDALVPSTGIAKLGNITVTADATGATTLSWTNENKNMKNISNYYNVEAFDTDKNGQHLIGDSLQPATTNHFLIDPSNVGDRATIVVYGGKDSNETRPIDCFTGQYAVGALFTHTPAPGSAEAGCSVPDKEDVLDLTVADFKDGPFDPDCIVTGAVNTHGVGVHSEQATIVGFAAPKAVVLKELGKKAASASNAVGKNFKVPFGADLGPNAHLVPVVETPVHASKKN